MHPNVKLLPIMKDRNFQTRCYKCVISSVAYIQIEMEWKRTTELALTVEDTLHRLLPAFFEASTAFIVPSLTTSCMPAAHSPPVSHSNCSTAHGSELDEHQHSKARSSQLPLITDFTQSLERKRWGNWKHFKGFQFATFTLHTVLNGPNMGTLHSTTGPTNQANMMVLSTSGNKSVHWPVCQLEAKDNLLELWLGLYDHLWAR